MPLPTAITSIITSIVTSAIEVAATAPALPPDPGLTPLRTFPAQARKGELQPPAGGLEPLTINGKTLPRAPGLQIRNEYNMLVMPTMLQQAVPVRYELDFTGAVQRVWVLSAAEAAAPDAENP